MRTGRMMAIAAMTMGALAGAVAPATAAPLPASHDTSVAAGCGKLSVGQVPVGVGRVAYAASIRCSPGAAANVRVWVLERRAPYNEVQVGRAAACSTGFAGTCTARAEAPTRPGATYRPGGSVVVSAT